MRLTKYCYRYLKFLYNYLKFKNICKNRYRFDIRWGNRYPLLFDITKNTQFDTHYVYHSAWAARIISLRKPSKHIDISSNLYFIGIVSAFVPVEFYDYRPANLALTGIQSGFADLYKLPFKTDSISSLSCMHVVEHVGLGRYGDKLDPDGDIRAVEELKRVLAPGGSLLFVVPVGKPRIMFNAHRIYAYDMVLDMFSDVRLKEFSLIPDDALEAGIIQNASREQANGQKYGCGCFHFQK